MGYMAYYELNIDYIIENYCVNKEKPQLQCNGKCHLAKQLAVTTNDTEDNTSYLTSFFEAFFPVYFQEYNYSQELRGYELITLNNWNYNNQFTSLFKDNLDPPPKA